MSAYSQKRTFKHPATSLGAIPLDCYDSSWGLAVSEESVERRLTTILAADVVGYSLLVELSHLLQIPGHELGAEGLHRGIGTRLVEA